ncbi:hypothetical protein B9Z55_027594 [Caenorhabditis nigoni]|uniref:Uncharacterized protein n=1 Tax=Caenorhabditis nigoni TaxID=1611254 RepID=A0A2G5SF78_9PELO|nr:hypothetical protein B9Z55_027594 [Caenorhabditis nigoni]
MLLLFARQFFVLASREVGSILLDISAPNVAGNTGREAEIVDTCRGKYGSSDMVAQCQYTECLVPPVMLNRAGKIERIFFAWKVNWKTNLGPGARELEEDDDISRQMRQTKMAYEASLRREKDKEEQALIFQNTFLIIFTMNVFFF